MGPQSYVDNILGVGLWIVDINNPCCVDTQGFHLIDVRLTMISNKRLTTGNISGDKLFTSKICSSTHMLC